MGVSRKDFRGIAVKVYSEELITAYEGVPIGAPRLVEMIIIEDWDRNILNAAERAAVRKVWDGFRNDGFFVFDPDDINRMCGNCKNVADNLQDCKVYPSHGTCHLSIPQLWEAKEN